ncbi:MAG: hemolysin family protein [Desulfobacterota bacterium]|nr:hemolysin family protein [Thermodesulfobacteriota bacterium]
MKLLILYFLLTVCVSFLCSLMEAVLLSITPAYADALAKKKHPAGTRLQKLKQSMEQPLAAILTLNTIANTAGAAGVGAQAAVVFGSRSLGIISALLTLTILFASEIMPKTIGSLYWRRLAAPVAMILPVVIAALYPLVWLSMRLTRALTHTRKVHPVSREEVSALAEQGVRSGGISPKESLVLKNIMRFHTITASDIMTPRTVVFAVDETMTVAAFMAAHSDTPFSRIPIFKENKDDITGYVLKYDILMCQIKGDQDMQLKSLKRSIHTVPDTIDLIALFELFLKERQHIMLVADEHGGMDGIVTMEDVVETLLGLEIVDEKDTVEDMRALARERSRKKRQEKLSTFDAENSH